MKDKGKTPNFKGTEKVVRTKINRKMLQVKCAVCGIRKPGFAGKLSESSLAEGTSLFDDFASTVREAFIRKGVPYLAKKELKREDIMLLKRCGILQHKRV